MATNIKIIDKDLGWKNIKKQIRSLNGLKIKIGLWGQGDPDRNLAYRGAVHQYGARIRITPKMRSFLHIIGIHVKAGTSHIIIPKRPFMSNAFDNGVNKLFRFIVNEFKKVMQKKQTMKIAIQRIGNFHESQIKREITTGDFEKNHPITIKRKGSSRPLIDKSTMRNGVEFKVEK